MTASLNTRWLRLALAGDMIEPLKLLLEDVITDSGAHYALTSQPGACDVAIVMVSWGEELHALAAARAQAGDAPLLAILPFSDEGLAKRVLLGGAQGWFALDTPLALLRASLLRLADLGTMAAAG